jgi:hypothetical protein
MKDQETVVVSEVSESEDYYSISTEQGTGFGFEKKYGVVPKKGDTITLHTKNWSIIRGMDLNGVKVFYKTDADLDREHKEWCEKNQREKEERFEKEKASLDAKYEALPKVFKDRIDKFRANNPKFRVDFEGYEMFTCEQAVVIADALKTKEAIEEFKNLDWAEQKAKVPLLDEGHSGNTFGCACALAYWYLEQPENVTKMYGALAPLVGSEEYGCVPKTTDEESH